MTAFCSEENADIPIQKGMHILAERLEIGSSALTMSVTGIVAEWSPVSNGYGYRLTLSGCIVTNAQGHKMVDEEIMVVYAGHRETRWRLYIIRTLPEGGDHGIRQRKK